MFAPRYFAPRMFAPRFFPPDADGAVVIDPEITTGGGQSKRYAPGIGHDLKSQAFREDEEFIAVLQAFLNRKH